MRVPESWLRSFVSPDWSSAEIAERLTMAGLEVEDAAPAAPPFTGVVVAEVRSVARHPNADEAEVRFADGRRLLHREFEIEDQKPLPAALRNEPHRPQFVQQ